MMLQGAGYSGPGGTTSNVIFHPQIIQIFSFNLRNLRMILPLAGQFRVMRYMNVA